MIIYNVTLSIDEEVSADWLLWMQETHIPSIMATGFFMECRLSKILGEQEGGIAYSAMYLARDQAALDGYNLRYASDMQKAHWRLPMGLFGSVLHWLMRGQDLNL